MKNNNKYPVAGYKNLYIDLYENFYKVNNFDVLVKIKSSCGITTVKTIDDKTEVVSIKSLYNKVVMESIPKFKLAYSKVTGIKSLIYFNKTGFMFRQGELVADHINKNKYISVTVTENGESAVKRIPMVNLFVNSYFNSVYGEVTNMADMKLLRMGVGVKEVFDHKGYLDIDILPKLYLIHKSIPKTVCVLDRKIGVINNPETGEVVKLNLLTGGKA